MPSFYTPELKSQTKTLVIRDDEFHHISRVFRKRAGEEIVLTSGSGVIAQATISQMNKKELTVEITEIRQEQLSSPSIAVAFPLLKNKHDAMIVEKLTELGVKDFFPVVSHRCVRQPNKNTREKFEKIAIAAIKQCDNAYLPNVHECADLEDLIPLLKEQGYHPCVALEFGEHKLLDKIAAESAKPLCLIIGPEGGFTREEAEYFVKNEVALFSLGNHILRAETAAIAASAQLLAYYLNQNPEYY